MFNWFGLREALRRPQLKRSYQPCPASGQNYPTHRPGDPAQSLDAVGTVGADFDTDSTNAGQRRHAGISATQDRWKPVDPKDGVVDSSGASLGVSSTLIPAQIVMSKGASPQDDEPENGGEGISEILPATTRLRSSNPSDGDDEVARDKHDQRNGIQIFLNTNITSRFARPVVWVPVLLAVGGCIALGFFLLDGRGDGGSANPMRSIPTATDNAANQKQEPNDVLMQVSTTRLLTSTAVGSTPASAAPVTTIKVVATPALTVAQTVTPTTVAVGVTIPPPRSEVDPRFDSCEQAMKEGFGPYVKGTDREYEWYSDDNRDGVVCDK